MCVTTKEHVASYVQRKIIALPWQCRETRLDFNLNHFSTLINTFEASAHEFIYKELEGKEPIMWYFKFTTT
jgi:hypothetical protein